MNKLIAVAALLTGLAAPARAGIYYDLQQTASSSTLRQVGAVKGYPSSTASGSPTYTLDSVYGRVSAKDVVVSSGPVIDVRSYISGNPENNNTCLTTTDVSASIQAAIDACGTQSSAGRRCKLYFPAGCYYTTASLVVSSGSFLTIQGDGRANTFLYNVAGSSGALVIQGGASGTTAITNRGGVTISDIAIGAKTPGTTGLYLHGANNALVRNVWFFSTGATGYSLRVNGGGQNQYEDLIFGWGNTAFPTGSIAAVPSATVDLSSGISAIKIESIDSPPVTTAEHSFNNIRSGGDYRSHAIDVVNSSTAWAMFGIKFSNAFVKGPLVDVTSACWHVDGAEVSIVNSDCEAQSTSNSSVEVNASTQVSTLIIQGLRGGNANLKLDTRKAGSAVNVSNSAFYQLVVGTAPTTVFGNNIKFEVVPPVSGGGRITDATNLGWTNVINGGPAIGYSTVGAVGFTGPNAVFSIAGDGDVGNGANSPVLVLRRPSSTASQNATWNIGVNADQTFQLWDASNTIKALACGFGGTGCIFNNKITAASATITAELGASTLTASGYFAVAGATLTAGTNGIVTMPSQPFARVTLASAGQTIGSASTIQIYFNALAEGNQGMWVATSSSAVTVPAGGAGGYMCTCSLGYAAAAANVIYTVIQKNGSTVEPYGNGLTNATGPTTLTSTVVTKAVAGDVFKCAGRDDTGSITIGNAGHTAFACTKVF